jgi:hypothetical protein
MLYVISVLWAITGLRTAPLGQVDPHHFLLVVSRRELPIQKQKAFRRCTSDKVPQWPVFHSREHRS